MSAPTSDLDALLRTLSPRQQPGVYAFATLPAGMAIDPNDIIASIREPEGLSVVVAEADAARLGLTVLMRCAWLTLQVHSDLQTVGLTAAFSTALGQAGIGCNVVAGACHDHLFVPHAQAEAAMRTLLQLQQAAIAASGPT